MIPVIYPWPCMPPEKSPAGQPSRGLIRTTKKATHPGVEHLDKAVGLGVAGKVGAGLFGLWGILHLWIGFEGLHQYIVSPVNGQWRMLIGGKAAPVRAFAFPTDPLTAHVHANLLLNFCIDVAGYGALAISVAWKIFRQTSWLLYLIGVFMVGIADVSFTLLQQTSGIIAVNIPSVSGPVIWLLATIITPFGMPAVTKSFGQYRI